MDKNYGFDNDLNKESNINLSKPDNSLSNFLIIGGGIIIFISIIVILLAFK